MTSRQGPSSGLSRGLHGGVRGGKRACEAASGCDSPRTGESSRLLRADQHASACPAPAPCLPLITDLEPQSEPGGSETTGAAAVGTSGPETLVAPRSGDMAAGVALVSGGRRA